MSLASNPESTLCLDEQPKDMPRGSITQSWLRSSGCTFGKIRSSETAECWWCGEAELLVDHLSTKSAGNGGGKDGL